MIYVMVQSRVNVWLDINFPVWRMPTVYLKIFRWLFRRNEIFSFWLNFVTDCIASCHFDSIHCNQWWKCHRNNILISVSSTVLSDEPNYLITNTCLNWIEILYFLIVLSMCHILITISNPCRERPWVILLADISLSVDLFYTMFLLYIHQCY